MTAEKITAMVVDDEKDGQEVLLNLLNRYFPEIAVPAVASGVDEAFDLVARHRPDLVFLDIQMPGKDGFELLKQYTEVPFGVIFVTGFDRYAIDAIRFSALDYITKPVEIPVLAEAIRRARKAIHEKREQHLQIVNLLYNLEAGPEAKKIAVHHAEKVHVLATSQIECIEADGRYSKLCTTEAREFYTARCMREFEEYLADNPHFVRISKSCMININHLRSYDKGEPCILEMNSGRSFEISRRRKPEVLALLRNL